MVRAGKTSPGSPSIFLATAGLVPASSVSLGNINHRGLLALSSGEENLGGPRSLPSAVGLFIFTKSLSHHLAFWRVVRTSQLIHPDVHLDTPHPSPCYKFLWWLQWGDHGFLKISDESCLHCSMRCRLQRGWPWTTELPLPSSENSDTWHNLYEAQYPYLKMGKIKAVKSILKFSTVPGA